MNSTFRKIFNTGSQQTVDVCMLAKCLVVSRLSGQLRYANASFSTTLVLGLHITHCAGYFVAIAMTELESCCTEV